MRHGFPCTIDWNRVQQEYEQYAAAQHVHNRWEGKLKLSSISNVLGTAKRSLQWAWQQTDVQINGLDALLNCEIMYARTQKLQNEGRSPKYIADEVCFLLCLVPMTAFRQIGL